MTAPEPNDEASFTGQAAKDEEDVEEADEWEDVWEGDDDEQE